MGVESCIVNSGETFNCTQVGESLKPWLSLQRHKQDNYPCLNKSPALKSTLQSLCNVSDVICLLQYVPQVTQMLSDKGGVPRLGVPPFGHTECTHGTLNDGTILTTLFPQALSFARRSEPHSNTQILQNLWFMKISRHRNCCLHIPNPSL